MNNQKQTSLLLSSRNPRSSVKSRFTRGFLSALMRMRKQKYSCRRREMVRRYRRVKIAADKSMAVAVGSRRAWSRAILRRIHNHHHYNKKKKKEEEEESKGGGDDDDDEARELRKLVPGGEAMDLCSLLEETAHYIKCLVTQVQVMRSIDHLYSI